MKREKQNAKLMLCLLLALVMALAFMMTACGSSDQDAQEDEETVAPQNLSLMDDPDATRSNDPKLASKAEKLNEDPANFYGTWVSKSADAENLYGNLEITILENGKVKANITGENYNGTWKKIDGGIRFATEFVTGEIYYGPTCIMTFREFEGESEGDDDIMVVLEKVK